MTHDSLLPRTFPLIFAAPSGAGKTTLARELGRRRQDVEFSVSATTRPPRAGERDAVDYFFCSEEEFRGRIAADGLLEWAEVHGYLYGTPRSNLVTAVDRRHFLLLDIDVQGSRQVKALVPEAVSIFVLPPDGRELAARLVGRGSEEPERLRRRLVAAREEIRAAGEFDYVLINDDVDRAVDTLEKIIAVESMRPRRANSLSGCIAKLIGEIDAVLES